MFLTDEEKAEFRRELGERIGIVVARYPTKSMAASTVDITVEQLNKWIAGTVKVPADGLFALAGGVGADLGWLASGRHADGVPEPNDTTLAELNRLVAGVLRDISERSGTALSKTDFEKTVSRWQGTIVRTSRPYLDPRCLNALVPWAAYHIEREILGRPGPVNRP